MSFQSYFKFEESSNPNFKPTSGGKLLHRLGAETEKARLARVIRVSK